MRSALLAVLVLVTCAAPTLAELPSVVDRYVCEDGETTAISSTNITTVSTTTYSEALRIADSGVQSVGMTIDTTQTISATVSVQALLTDAAGAESWVDFDPAVSKTFTGDYSKVWALYLPVQGVVRFKFTADATYPYEVENLVIKRK